MNRDREAFIKHVVKELQEENLAIFAGAGLSAGGGFVSWPELLRPIAEELGLDVDKEHDLVTLAQFHCNSNGNNRSQLNQRLIEEFARDAVETESHRVLARLPISIYWTTNYDSLIENTLVKSGKVPDVKYTKEQLAVTIFRRNAIVYKMHGDKAHPNDAVLTKDDYERYHIKMNQYLSALKGDLISKTFIFIGFSFTDPNLDYILSRVRVAYEDNQRRHYCFIRSIKQKKDEPEADFKYNCRKQELFISDLSRFNIKTILVDEFSEIEELLLLIESNYKKKTLFVSGAAHEFGPWGEEQSHKFIAQLSAGLIKNGCKIVSGFGLGVGSSVICGALEEVYMKQGRQIQEQLLLRPFPQPSKTQNFSALWTQYRDDMIAHAGFSVFLFGNKISDQGLLPSNGMWEEYEISKSKNNIVIPVGATGYVARDIWEKEVSIFKEENVKDDIFYDLFIKLGDEKSSPDEILSNTLRIIKYCIEKGDLHG